MSLACSSSFVHVLMDQPLQQHAVPHDFAEGFSVADGSLPRGRLDRASNPGAEVGLPRRPFALTIVCRAPRGAVTVWRGYR